MRSKNQEEVVVSKQGEVGGVTAWSWFQFSIGRTIIVVLMLIQGEGETAQKSGKGEKFFENRKKYNRSKTLSVEMMCEDNARRVKNIALTRKKI